MYNSEKYLHLFKMIYEKLRYGAINHFMSKTKSALSITFSRLMPPCNRSLCIHALHILYNMIESFYFPAAIGL